MKELEGIENIITKVNYTIHRKADSSWCVERRKLKDNEIVLIVGGKGRIEVDGKLYEVKKNDFFFFASQVPNACYTDLKDYLQLIGIHFDYKILGELDQIPIQSYMKIKEGDTEIQEAFREINRLWNGQVKGYEWKMNLVLQHLLYRLTTYEERKKLEYKNIERIEKIFRYIENNYTQKLTLEKLAHTIGISIPYLNKIFKQQTGLTPIQYINKYRINQSKDLLLYTQSKIEIIANQVGFEDSFYYSRIFSKLEGMSPLQYRQINKRVSDSLDK